jgi:hypothetical protein
MSDRTIQISLSVALIVSIFSVSVHLAQISNELTRVRATTEKHVYGAVQNDPKY